MSELVLPPDVSDEEAKQIKKEFASDVAYKQKNKVKQTTPRADA